MPEIQQSEINDLINLIAPYNNRYREIIDQPKSGLEALKQMWFAGDEIQKFIESHGVKPHALYWKIYGKAEGLKNSYITRDFMSYCLRIRKLFNSVSLIESQYPRLNKYSSFREALPLLENPKYKLSDEDMKNLIDLLNSSKSPASIKQTIVSIKNSKIGRKNPRTQKLDAMRPFIEHFVNFYDEVFTLVKSGTQEDVNAFRNSFQNGAEDIAKLARSILALTQEGLTFDKITVSENKNLDTFIKDLGSLQVAPVETRNRYRRLVPVNKLYRLSEMLNNLSDDDVLNQYRKNHKNL